MQRSRRRHPARRRRGRVTRLPRRRRANARSMCAQTRAPESCALWGAGRTRGSRSGSRRAARSRRPSAPSRSPTTSRARVERPRCANWGLRPDLRAMGFLVHWLVTAVALAVGAHVVPGIHVSSGAALIVAALVLGLVNAVVRPVLLLLTLRLFYLVVNGVAFALAAWLVPGFTVASLGSAIGGALVVSVLSSLMSLILTPRSEA